MSKQPMTGQQKLLVVVALCVLTGAFIMLLKIWGIDISEELVGRIIGTCVVIALVAAVLFAIISSFRDERKDKDNFFN